MNTDAFDRLVRLAGRRSSRRAAIATLAALPGARAGAASAQVCAPVGALCTTSYGCCDGTPCPMNLTTWVGICLGTSATAATTGTTATTTAAQGTGTSKDGVPGGQRRVADDGNALGPRAKLRHRRRSQRDEKRKRRKKR